MQNARAKLIKRWEIHAGYHVQPLVQKAEYRSDMCMRNTYKGNLAQQIAGLPLHKASCRVAGD